jgi:hypothetical protein
MKIYELTGIKSNPAFKAAQDLNVNQDDDNQETMRTNLRSKLANQGWEPAGSGMSAEVFLNPSYDYALKIFSSSDRKWMAFFKYAKQNQDNPHVPKVKGNLVKLSPTAYAARIEKLTPLKKNGDKTLLKYVDPELIDEYNNSVGNAHNRIALEWILDNEDNEEFIKNKWPKLYQLKNDLWALLSHYTGDFDGYQFMVRGDTVVWIDP